VKTLRHERWSGKVVNEIFITSRTACCGHQLHLSRITWCRKLCMARTERALPYTPPGLYLAARYTGTMEACQSFAMKTQSSPYMLPLILSCRGASKAARHSSVYRNCSATIKSISITMVGNLVLPQKNVDTDQKHVFIDIPDYHHTHHARQHTSHPV
jgi:hypothetical protein